MMSYMPSQASSPILPLSTGTPEKSSLLSRMTTNIHTHLLDLWTGVYMQQLIIREQPHPR